MSDSLSTLIEISLKTASEALLASSSLQPAKLKTRSSTTDLRWRVRFESNIDNRSCLALFSDPSTFPFIQPGTKLAGIDRFSVLQGSVASLDFCPDLRAMLGHPGFLLVRQGNGVTHQLIHGLAGPSLNVLLDHFFQLRSQMNLYAHSLPQVLMPQPE